MVYHYEEGSGKVLNMARIQLFCVGILLAMTKAEARFMST
jgi:hypothetical protein